MSPLVLLLGSGSAALTDGLTYGPPPPAVNDELLRDVSDAGQALLDMIPDYLRSDPQVRGVLDVIARELQRIEDAGLAIAAGAFPQHADDSFALLGIMEAQLGIPVEPAGLTVGQRRDLVLAHIRKRSAAAGSDWEAAVTTALGTTAWSYHEDPTEARIVIKIPSGTGSLTAAQVLSLVRDVTPAHLDLSVSYDAGFLVGISEVGVDAL